MSTVSLSIITPSYNRAPFLENCFRSLENQTNDNFEWILVDDGSSDNTGEVVGALRSDRFPIHFLHKENGGKHTALNAAQPYIQGKYVLILDSDDTLTETAVEEVLTAWKRYEADERVGIVTFLKGIAPDQPVCTVADFDVPVEIMRYRRIRRIRTDCCEVIRAELFKKYPFPVFEGERFLAESALWDRVSFTHRCVYIDSVIYLCEYREDGLTKAGRALRIRNPRGGMFTSNLRMDRTNYWKDRFKNGLLYACYRAYAGVSIRSAIYGCRSPWLAALCMPAGYILYRYWKQRY